jgi:hypothetical protein
VVEALRHVGSCWGRDGQVLNDMKMLLKNFQVWQLTHFNRGANVAAHTIAKLALSIGVEQIWHENFPLCMHDIVNL